jgi:hypothetical protein
MNEWDPSEPAHNYDRSRHAKNLKDEKQMMLKDH